MFVQIMETGFFEEVLISELLVNCCQSCACKKLSFEFCLSLLLDLLWFYFVSKIRFSKKAKLVCYVVVLILDQLMLGWLSPQCFQTWQFTSVAITWAYHNIEAGRFFALYLWKQYSFLPTSHLLQKKKKEKGIAHQSENRISI